MSSGIQQGAAPTPAPASHQPQQLLTDHLDLWTTAVRHKSTAGRGSNRKIELAGINKLRELILELAVRGKLVPQNPDDEPASELLKRIEAEKAQLIKDGKLKKQKPLPPVSEDEKPFELPQGWEVVRLQTAFDVRDGTHDSPKYHAEGIPLVTSKNLSSGTLDFSDVKFISEEDHKKISERSSVSRGDILFAMIGTIGNPVIVDTDIDFSIKNVALFKRYAPELGNERFLSLQLQVLTSHLKSIAAGGVQKFTSLGMLRILPTALPPLAEQHRIVAKVEELMTLCDQLEQQSEHQLDAHQQLTETLLSALLTPAAGALTNATSAQELSDNWQRLAQHFDLLFSGPMGAWAIDRLKDTILQLAVMGKLVPQNPDDEPASELLKRIDAEKARLVKEGKIKKQKPLPPVSDDEKPFELPKGWEWVRLDSVALNSEAGWSPQCLDTPRELNNWGILKVSAVTWAIYNPNENKALPLHLDAKPEYEVQDGDFLISRANTAELVARSVVVPSNSPQKLMMSDKIIRFRFSSLVNVDYLNKLNNCELSRTYYLEVAGGTSSSMKNVSRVQIQNLCVPLPPIAEQHRIVAKVEELMALCDQLKERLQQASETQLNLTDAIVEKALS